MQQSRLNRSIFQKSSGFFGEAFPGRPPVQTRPRGREATALIYDLPRERELSSLFVKTMSALLEVERLLTELSPAERAQVIQWAARELGDAFPGIESVPGVCGGEPCVVRTRIPVWLLEQARRHGVNEAEILRCYPTLRAEDLANAWAFVRIHRVEIEQQIRENEAA